MALVRVLPRQSLKLTRLQPVAFDGRIVPIIVNQVGLDWPYEDTNLLDFGIHRDVVRRFVSPIL